MIDAALRASLAAFDDAALATLANVGLVRRAHRDVEEGKVKLVSVGVGRASVEADGQLVELDGRGPRAANCACTSASVCRHRIAAVLYLLGLTDAPVVGSLEAVPESESAIETVEQSTADDECGTAVPSEIAAALDPATLERWAGKSSWRAALELLGTVVTVEPLANAIAVTFADLDGPVRLLRGQGFDGIVSKAPKARTKAYHGAAVLAARAHFGASLPEADDESDAGASVVVDIDPNFLDRVAAGLREVATLGFNLAPLPLEESLFELSVSSRADSLPRLSAMLRAIAAQIRLRRQRALAFDPDRMLELAATAYALVRALASGPPDRRASLAGKVRRDFAPIASLDLIGCGGEHWRTDTGARGVTAWFLEPNTGTWLSTTIARGPGQDPDFKPIEAWRVQPFWQTEPLAVLAHARIDLSDARRSSDDRLSAPASARATIVARDIRPDPAWPGVVRRWRDLRGAWLRQTGLGLDARESAAACLIVPSETALPYFDDLAQQLVWPVRDADGDWLALTIDQDETFATAIQALEANANRGWRGMVLVRLSRAGDALSVHPLTLFAGESAIDLTLWRQHNIGARGVGVGSMRDWLARLRRNGGRRFSRYPRDPSDAALAGAWRQLLDCVETGPALAQSLGGGSNRSISAHADRLDSRGFPTLARLMREAQDASGILASGYGLLVAKQQRSSAPLLR
ncbi:hypothetical protein TPR58_12325 [Sphingomonas sp. HF-S3]|uniref:SWIM-type domain-containing protein n=1 Tax=Sphingomonas rustica TaxID=3103142 RepID=A0ABV0BD10_9SPHN